MRPSTIAALIILVVVAVAGVGLCCAGDNPSALAKTWAEYQAITDRQARDGAWEGRPPEDLATHRTYWAAKIEDAMDISPKADPLRLAALHELTGLYGVTRQYPEAVVANRKLIAEMAARGEVEPGPVKNLAFVGLLGYRETNAAISAGLVEELYLESRATLLRHGLEAEVGDLQEAFSETFVVSDDGLAPLP